MQTDCMALARQPLRSVVNHRVREAGVFCQHVRRALEHFVGELVDDFQHCVLKWSVLTRAARAEVSENFTKVVERAVDEAPTRARAHQGRAGHCAVLGLAVVTPNDDALLASEGLLQPRVDAPALQVRNSEVQLRALALFVFGASQGDGSLQALGEVRVEVEVSLIAPAAARQLEEGAVGPPLQQRAVAEDLRVYSLSSPTVADGRELVPVTE